ncbi:hypothetical protein HHK36_020345 [Tetracentron sinense]|uniref:Non-lysosomal glucosylceramidase n=1 Tax=Tetracentron sinense TaxID=13715 RepID=A0A834YRI4_TETSI|nr:hypothetical protein HHK36_020345 [Tetracentron sinense]
MVSGNLFHCRKHSWPPEEYVSRATLQLMDFDSAAPPEQAWRRRLNSHANILKEFSVTFMEAIKMVHLGIRLWSYIREEAAQGRTAPIDPFTRERCKPSASQGVPLGGMGSGNISRGFRGEFRHWQIIPGLCETSPVMANQFSIFISREGGNKSYASVLAPGQQEVLGKSRDQGISSWGWNLSGQHSTYHALFPRAWTIYDGEPDPELKISCRQISPFIPHNYRESSLPTAVFVYTPFDDSGRLLMDVVIRIEKITKRDGPLVGQEIRSPRASREDLKRRPLWAFDNPRSVPLVLVNTGRERAKVSLLLTWANSIGGISHLSGDHVNEPFMLVHRQRWSGWGTSTSQASGEPLIALLTKDNPPVTFAIAACETQNVNVTVLPCFGLSEASCITAKDMWSTMAEAGEFDRENFNSGHSMPSSPGDTLCAAVSASTWVEPHGKCTVAFSLGWSSPKVKFRKGCSYHRRYTKYYGTSERSALDLVHDALTNYKWWEEEIEKWQSPILRDGRLPEWYKFTLFNELYFLVAGGTVWIDSPSPVTNNKSSFSSNQHTSTNVEDPDVRVTEAKVNCRQGAVIKHTGVGGSDSTAANGFEDEEEKTHTGSLCKDESVVTVLQEKRNCYQSVQSSTLCDLPIDGDDVGRFLYLEGVEYIMWCTYDVHFYASFALLVLFPKIELNIQRDFAKAVLTEDEREVKFLAEGKWGIRKVRGAVPHDLGTHDPWHEMNGYNIHDTSRWKDLNSKFVLQVYRDFFATGDLSFGIDVWPAVRAAIEYMDQFDRDCDGLIENEGFPDQTYDTWTVHGVSAYCGCLWLAVLQAAAAMADRLGDKDFAERCQSKFLQAKPVFEAKLWNGSYFNYDSGSSSNSRSIQADQLAGQWYTASSGLPPLFDDFKIRSSLQKIYDFNVMKVKGGRMGAVNGMHPNGKVDVSCMQSREIWTGVTYGVAATMIHAGMVEQAFTTAEGIFTSGWSEEGFG